MPSKAKSSRFGIAAFVSSGSTNVTVSVVRTYGDRLNSEILFGCELLAREMNQGIGSSSLGQQSSMMNVGEVGGRGHARSSDSTNAFGRDSRTTRSRVEADLRSRVARQGRPKRKSHSSYDGAFISDNAFCGGDW